MTSLVLIENLLILEPYLQSFPWSLALRVTERLYQEDLEVVLYDSKQVTEADVPERISRLVSTFRLWEVDAGEFEGKSGMVPGEPTFQPSVADILRRLDEHGDIEEDGVEDAALNKLLQKQRALERKPSIESAHEGDTVDERKQLNLDIEVLLQISKDPSS